MEVNNSLEFNGNAMEALEHYKEVFAKEIEMIFLYKDTPMEDISENLKEKVCHSEIRLTDNFRLMCVDTMVDEHLVGNNQYISLNFTEKDDLEEAKTLFQKLSQDGVIVMPFEKMFWNAYYATFFDKFGIGWVINYQLDED